MVPLVKTNLMIEKNFQRLLTTAEKSVEENSIEDWRLNQVENFFRKIFNEKKNVSREFSVRTKFDRDVERHAKDAKVSSSGSLKMIDPTFSSNLKWSMQFETTRRIS